MSPNVKPGVLLFPSDLEEMKAKAIFVKDSVKDEAGVGTWWGGKGVFVEFFTKPQARAEVEGNAEEAVLEMGTSSVWNDNCEYDSLVDKDCRCDFEGKGTSIGYIKGVSQPDVPLTAGRWKRRLRISGRLSCAAPAMQEFSAMPRPGRGQLTCWDSLKYNIAQPFWA